MKPGRFTIPASIAVTFLMAMMFPAKSQFVADDSYAGIPPQDLTAILKTVAAKFDRPDSVLFAGLRLVDRGYCGFVNATLDYEAFVPFFFDAASLRIELGSKGKLSDTPTIKQLEACR